MFALYKRLTKVYATRAVVLTLSLATILAVSSWIDLKAVDLSQQIYRALPIAACISAVWTLFDWRSQGGDIALASGGRSHWLLLPWMVCVAAPPFALRAKPNGSQFAIEFGRNVSKMTARLGEDIVQFRWNETSVFEIINGQEQHRGELQPPRRHHQPHLDSGFFLFCLRSLFQTTLLLWIVAPRRQPTPSMSVLCTALCIGLSNAMTWIISTS